MKQINMLLYIYLFFPFAKTICLTETEFQQVKKNIEQIEKEAKNPTRPGAFEAIIHAWENVKILDPTTAEKFSSYIDRLKSIFKSDQDKQEPSPKQ